MLNIRHPAGRIYQEIKNHTGIFWVAASQLTLLFANFLLLKLLTINLSIDDFGYYSLCMSIILFVRQILYDPISITGGKAAGSSAQNLKELSKNFQVIGFLTDYLGLTIVTVGFVTLFFMGVVIDGSLVGLIICICTLYLCANAAQGVFINLFNSSGDRKAAALFSMADSTLKVSFIVGIVLVSKISLINVLASISISTFCVFLFLRRYIYAHFSFKVVSGVGLSDLARQSILMSAPLYLPVLFAAFKSVSDRWILTSFTGVDELAVYSVLLQMGYTPVLLLFGVAQTYFAPKIYQICGEHSAKTRQELKKLISKLLLSVIIFTGIFTGISIIASEWLFGLLTGEAYHDASVYMPFFVASGSISALAGMLQVVAIGVLEVRAVARLMYISVFLTTVITLFFIIGWGFLGAISALLMTSVVSTLFFWRRIYHELSRW